jgi:hypothetical protein
MIIIGTRTTVKCAPPLDQQKVLGNDPTCVRPECPGVCRLYQVQKYCTLYFIPVTKCGPDKEIVKCERCALAVELDAFLEYQKRLQAASKVEVVAFLHHQKRLQDTPASHEGSNKNDEGEPLAVAVGVSA